MTVNINRMYADILLAIPKIQMEKCAVSKAGVTKVGDAVDGAIKIVTVAVCIFFI
jgi:hypothetical protein